MPNSTGSDLTALRIQPLEFDWHLTLTRAPTKLANAYWHSRLNGRAMPSRADLNPAAMRKFTSHVGLVEIHGDRPQPSYVIRRAGGAWEEVFGPMTGRVIDDFLPSTISRRWRQVFDAVLENKAPLRIHTRIAFQEKRWLSMEMLVAPLGEADEPNMLFTAFDSWTQL